jgi:hypothetical protein
MFEAKFQKLIEGLGLSRFLAAYLATGARKGVEDLHAAGAFTDSEAPALNRAMRSALYEAWLVAGESVNERRSDTDLFQERCWELMHEFDESDVADCTIEHVLSAACHRTAREFVQAKGTSDDEAYDFATAAMGEMRSYYRLGDRVVVGEASDDDVRLFDLAVGLIADYWEPAELSAEFAQLLDESGTRRVSDAATPPHAPIAAVQITFHGGRRSSFNCPSCGARISFTNAYPFSFMWKVCPKCRLQWVPTQQHAGSGLPVTDLAPGFVGELRVASSGSPV